MSQQARQSVVLVCQDVGLRGFLFSELVAYSVNPTHRDVMNRNLWLLAALQGLFLTNNVTFMAINGLVGLSLAPYGWMATIPLMGYVVGSALSTGVVARTQATFGRQRSFQLGLVVAMLSCLLCAYAAASSNFWLLCFSTMVAGYYNANAGLYRFAAAELAKPDAREKAVSLVMAAGLAGGVFGPALATFSRDIFAIPFAGAYMALTVVALLALGLITFIQFPPAAPKVPGATGRPLAQIMRQPVFIISAAAGALGYGVMNLLMAATPIAMQQCGLPFSDAALVLEWHVIGMFAPGFFTGHLIKRFGALPIMGVGVALNLACIGVALSGIELQQFLISLTLLGVGWNFLFTGSTTLSLSAYTAQERDRAQGALNFFVFATLALSSFASGVIVTTQGWTWLNYGSIVPLLLTAGGLVWLALKQPARAAAAQPRS